jgi:single-strand DNA-binding protein
MGSYNRTILMGNLTRDPEIRQVGDSSVTNIGLAVNEKYKTKAGEEREETLFIDCEMWGPRGEAFARYHGKGDAAHLEGRLKLDEWESDTGEKRTKIKLRVDNFTFVSGGKGNGESEAPMARRVSPNNKYADVPDGDIPF